VAIIDLPSGAQFDRIDWRPVTNVQANESQWNNSIRTLDLDNGYFAASVEIQVQTENEDRAWRVFWAKLRGAANNFRLPATQCQQTTITGTGIQVASGAAAGVTSLSTKNWANASTLLKAGQWIELNGQLLMLTADVPGTGTNRTIHFDPPTRVSATTGDAIEVENPCGTVFIPQSDGPQTRDGVMTWAFEAREAF
jgi:hypothetical protein